MFMLEKCNFNDGLFKSEASKLSLISKFETECRSKEKCTLSLKDYRHDMSPYCLEVERKRRAQGGNSFLLG